MSIRCLNIAVTDIGPAVLRRYCSVSDIGVVGAVGGGSGSTWDIYRLLIRSVHSLVPLPIRNIKEMKKSTGSVFSSPPAHYLPAR